MDRDHPCLFFRPSWEWVDRWGRCPPRWVVTPERAPPPDATFVRPTHRRLRLAHGADSVRDGDDYDEGCPPRPLPLPPLEHSLPLEKKAGAPETARRQQGATRASPTPPTSASGATQTTERPQRGTRVDHRLLHCSLVRSHRARPLSTFADADEAQRRASHDVAPLLHHGHSSGYHFDFAYCRPVREGSYSRLPSRWPSPVVVVVVVHRSPTPPPHHPRPSPSRDGLR